jgi:hypothetical protein
MPPKTRVTSSTPKDGKKKTNAEKGGEEKLKKQLEILQENLEKEKKERNFFQVERV